MFLYFVSQNMQNFKVWGTMKMFLHSYRQLIITRKVKRNHLIPFRLFVYLFIKGYELVCKYAEGFC